MSRKTLGSAVTAIGVIVVAIAALADQIGIGDEEAFGWTQIVGVIVGAVVAVSGFIITKLGDKPVDGVDTVE
jgi:hypothetical protein